MAVLYFAYGANMDPHRMSRRCPGAVALGPARLDGFRLAFNVYSTEWEGGAANLELDERAHVWGVLWSVPEEELRGLDAYHGHPAFFRREDVSVEGPRGRVVAFTFRVAHQAGTFIPPTQAYLRVLRSAVRLQGLPPEALDAIDRAAQPPYRPTIST